MKTLSLLFFFSFIILSSGCKKLEWKDYPVYQGTIQMLTKGLNDTITSDYTFDIRIKIKEDGFARVDDGGKIGCLGDVIWSSDSIKFESDECACHCDCDPRVDCIGDPILGTFDIIKNEAREFQFEDTQVFTTDDDGNPTLSAETIINLKLEE